MEGHGDQRLVNPAELLTSAEAAEQLRVSERTVKRLFQRGDLAFVRIGGRRFVEATEVRAFISRNTRRRVPA
jgi:excisionase family DNA binding protein